MPAPKRQTRRCCGSDRRQVPVLPVPADQAIQGMDGPAPRSGCDIEKFLGDQSPAFDGQFHRFGTSGPEIGFVHDVIPSVSLGKDASTRVAMQHGMEAKSIQSKNPPVA
jgi:hypothetical protein